MITVSFVSIALGLVATAFGILSALKAEDSINPQAEKVYKNFGKCCTYAAIICFTAALILPAVIPQYTVWQQNKEGEAELARAEQNRKIAIQEAKAKEEAATSLANAEVIRAQGIAKANEIIGESLQNNDAYIHYLWIEALRESENEVIYIPTEAGIPITESTRFFRKGEINE